MKHLLKRVSIVLAVVFCVGIYSATAQSAEEAYSLYESGIKALETKNFETAISSLSKSIEMYGSVTGVEGAATIEQSAKQALMQAHYAYGMNLYQDKNFDKALEQFATTAEQAKNNNNGDLLQKAMQYQGNVYNSKASTLYNEKDYDGAIAAANEALTFDADNEMSYFWRGRSYDKKDDLNNMKADLDKCMELTKDDAKKAKTYANAAKIAGAAFMNAGVNDIKNKKYTAAIESLKIAVSYPDINPNAYYYTAVAYNGLSKWNEAIEAASTALTMELKDPSATYYELGRAHEGAGNTTEACNAYKKVTTGQSKQAAEYQMQHVLKCN